ncbi:hypothetical protein TCAL_08691 [Tigriopus californicus]|uniref:C2H2-type domain-containing protein n=1 Tax=Tigriopus californicus TaxID=6832 RepID=A0A553NDP5_TIGCA|nr:uncharacterized protein LOC131889636 [Tigriopus californicus]TRY63563.1 hypothetical protein TCAL_08691 [Tigriopus californicus]
MFTITTQSRFKSKSDGIVECVSLRTPTKRESRPLHFVFNSLMESTSEGQLPTVKNAKIVSLPPPVCPDHPSQTTGSDNNLTTPIQVKRIKYHCFHCKKVFLSRTGWKEHASAAGADHENLQPCREPHATHRLVSGTFDSFDEARAWATAQEFDKTMSIVTSQTNYLIYKCRHNSRLKGSRLKPCPQRRRVSLMPFDCKARVVVNKTCICRCDSDNAKHICYENEDTIRMSGCLTHCHDISPRFDRIPKATKDNIGVLLQAGLSKSTILRDYCNSVVGQSNDHKIITMQDIRNIENHMKKKHVDPVINDPVQIFESRKQRSIKMLTEWRVALFAGGPQKEQEDIIQQVEEIEAKLKMKEVLNSAVDPGLSSTKTKNQREETPTESFMALPTGVIQANHWSNADIALEEEVQHCLESPVEDPNWLP